jgi:hypothetical protein
MMVLAMEATMIPEGFGAKLREDGSIDFETYEAEAARLRSRERDRIVWEVLLPALMRFSALLFAYALGRVRRPLRTSLEATRGPRRAQVPPARDGDWQESGVLAGR